MSAVIAAIAVAGLVAACNALSSAQLAANHPTSGGTYEYGHRWLVPWVGFVAGWMFLCAKSASAATAALGAVAYARRLGLGTDAVADVLLASGVVVAVTLLVLCGLRQPPPRPEQQPWARQNTEYQVLVVPFRLSWEATLLNTKPRKVVDEIF